MNGHVTYVNFGFTLTQAQLEWMMDHEIETDHPRWDVIVLADGFYLPVDSRYERKVKYYTDLANKAKEQA